MKTLKQFQDEQMKNPEFAKEYEALQSEFNVIEALPNESTSHNSTQKKRNNE